MDSSAMSLSPQFCASGDDSADCEQYQPNNSVNEQASGSYIRRQFADLINTDTTARFSIAKKGIILAGMELKRIPFGNWFVVDLSLHGELTLIENKQSADLCDIKTTAEKIEYIRDVFGFSISGLAKALKSSRPSVYSWLEDGEPNGKTSERIDQIYKLAKSWSEKNQYHFSPASLLKQPLGDMPSFLSLLGREELDINEIEKALIFLLQLMQSKRERMDRAKRQTEVSSLNHEQQNSNISNTTQFIGSVED
jgi:hypothetical protein